MEMMGQDTDFVTNLSKKLSPPLVTLLSSEPEVRTYVLNLDITVRYWVFYNPSLTSVSRFNRWMDLNTSGQWGLTFILILLWFHSWDPKVNLSTWFNRNRFQLK